VNLLYIVHKYVPRCSVTNFEEVFSLATNRNEITNEVLTLGTSFLLMTPQKKTIVMLGLMYNLPVKSILKANRNKK
jgi:hypothetical protein